MPVPGSTTRPRVATPATPASKTWRRRPPTSATRTSRKTPSASSPRTASTTYFEYARGRRSLGDRRAVVPDACGGSSLPPRPPRAPMPSVGGGVPLGGGRRDRAGRVVAVDDAEGVAQRRGPEVAVGVWAVGHKGDRVAGADQVGRAVQHEGELAVDDQQQLPGPGRVALGAVAVPGLHPHVPQLDLLRGP